MLYYWHEAQRMAMAPARIMAKAGGGCIINMSSGGATRAHRAFTAYDASKGGVEALTRAMALDTGATEPPLPSRKRRWITKRRVLITLGCAHVAISLRVH